MGWTDPIRNAAAGGLTLVGADGVATDVSRGRTHDLLVLKNDDSAKDKAAAAARLAGVGEGFDKADKALSQVDGYADKAKSALADPSATLGKLSQSAPGALDELSGKLSPSGGLASMLGPSAGDGESGAAPDLSELLSKAGQAVQSDGFGQMSKMLGVPGPAAELAQRVGSLAMGSGPEQSGPELGG